VVIADCKEGKCVAVSFDNEPAFVLALDHPVEVVGLATMLVDVVWGGMIYVVLDVAKIGLRIRNQNGPKLIENGKESRKQSSDHMCPSTPNSWS
jgi:proline racemase